MLVINNLTKSYGPKKVLNNVSLEIKKGEIGLLLGSSGVGKSTLLRVLNNLENYDSGTILLNNKSLDITKVPHTHSVGMVFQQFNLFEHMTVERNITFVLERAAGKSSSESYHIAQELLNKYGLSEKAKLLATQLSGGQKQRLAIARTLALKPQVICLDEPTSALDPLLTNYVATNIQNLAHEGYIVLVATHDTSLLQKLVCSIYLMEEGSIVETAYSPDFQKHPSSYPLIQRFVEGRHSH